MLEIFFLGTSAAIPTKKRGLPCIVIRREGEIIMLDCGEGTQMKFILSGFGVNKPMKIFITHLHGDHVLGLPGLLFSMNILGRSRKLEIYGPRGIKSFIETALKYTSGGLGYPITIVELEGEHGEIEFEEYIVKYVITKHSVLNYAYILEEKPKPGKFNIEKALELGLKDKRKWGLLKKGLTVKLEDGRVIRPEDVLGPPIPGIKIAYTGDGIPSDKFYEVALGSDVLIHEATYTSLLENKAVSEYHATAKIAALTACRIKAKLLILTHISARYEKSEGKPLLEEAREIFKNTILAFDGLKITVRRKNGKFIWEEDTL